MFPLVCVVLVVLVMNKVFWRCFVLLVDKFICFGVIVS